MKKSSVLNILIVWAVILALTPCFPAEPFRVVTFSPSDKVLRNPHMGLSIMARSRPEIEKPDKVPAWALDHASIAYFRLPWMLVVDEKGEYIFEKLDQEHFSAWRARGYRIAIRVMPANKYGPTSSIFPRESLGKNIRFHRQVQKIDGKDKELILPIYWDPEYLKEHARLAKALGEYALNHPDLDLVDMGGMGEYGEVHLHAWTRKDYEETGYTHEKYMGALFQMMDDFDRHLPRVQKAICPPGDDIPDPMIRMVVERAVREGWSLRHDGFMDDGATPRIHAYFEENRGLARWIWEPSGGVWFKGGFGAGKKIYPVADYFKAMERMEPQTANLCDPGNFGGMSETDRPEIAKMARRIGYRIGVSSVALPMVHEMTGGGAVMPLPFSLTLTNGGLARCFEETYARIRLKQGGATIHDEPMYFSKTISGIAPGSSRVENALIFLSNGLKPGMISMEVGLKTMQGQVLLLDNAESTDGTWLSLGSLPLTRVTRRSQSLDIMDQFAKAQLSPGVERSDTGEGLKIIGKDETTGWSFARFGEGKIPGGAFIRVRMEVKAWRGEISDSRLKFKFTAKGSGEKASRNVHSSEYDFTREGAWQSLSVDYQPQQDETIDFGLEKSRTAPTSINAVIREWVVEWVSTPNGGIGR